MRTKTKKVMFQVLPSDREALEQLAQFEGEAMSVVIRKLIRSRAQELGLSSVDPSKNTELQPTPIKRAELTEVSNGQVAA